MQSTTTTDWTGKKLGATPYQVLRRLGSGGMAEVYLAEDLHQRERVVVKTPHSQFLRQHPSFAARFRQETQALRRLVHPHIVRILDHSEHEGRPFLVLRFLEGGNLQRRMNSGRHGQQEAQPAEALATWLPEVASALDFMHTHGHLHRDVKPGNILFDEVGRPYLGDLGLTLAYRDHAFGPAAQPEARGFGTPRYMAPEMLGGAACDGRTDQFSLALVVWEWLTGRSLIPGDTPAQVLTGHQTLLPSLPRWLSDPWMPVFQKALAALPQQRYPTCHAFAQAVLDLAQPGFLPAPHQETAGPATFSLSALDMDTALEDPPPLAVTPLPEPVAPMPVRALPVPPPIPADEIDGAPARRGWRPWRLSGKVLVLVLAGVLGSLLLPGTGFHRRLARWAAPVFPNLRTADSPPAALLAAGEIPVASGEDRSKREEVLVEALRTTRAELIEARKLALSEKKRREKDGIDGSVLARELRTLREEKERLEKDLAGQEALRRDVKDLRAARDRLETDNARLQRDLRDRQTTLLNAQDQERRERTRRLEAENDLRQAKPLLDEALRVNLPTLTIRSNLAFTDPRDRVRKDAYCKTFLVPMKAGKSYVIEAKSTAIDTYLRVENGAGLQIAYDDDGGEGYNSKLTFRPTRSGPYRLIVTTYKSRQTGSFILEMKEQ